MAKAYVIDMDGVLVRGSTLVPGADGFIRRLQHLGVPFLVLTNNSVYTPGDLQARLHGLGLDVPFEALFTSAMATAAFLHQQRPEGRAYAVGERGLKTALGEIGYTLTDQQPDYVVLGETTAYSYAEIATAVRLVSAGTRFIATNPDVNGPGDGGIVPGAGALAALITAATGVKPYYIGKPNPLMMRSALRQLGVHSEDTTMIGDRMDTDMVAGIESGMRTILVLTGVTRQEDIGRFPYLPSRVVQSVVEIEP